MAGIPPSDLSFHKLHYETCLYSNSVNLSKSNTPSDITSVPPEFFELAVHLGVDLAKSGIKFGSSSVGKNVDVVSDTGVIEGTFEVVGEIVVGVLEFITVDIF